MPFKVIEVGTNRKPVCDFLLVINSNCDIPSRTVPELSQRIAEILDTLRFGSLRSTDTVHLRLTGKRVVDFLLVLIEHFARCYG